MSGEQNQNSLHGIYMRLTRALVDNGRDVNEVSEQFRSLETNRARVDFVKKQLTVFELLPKNVVRSKCKKEARKYREEGNHLFNMKTNGLALMKYNQSIVNAPPSTEEIALAYANRSAVLFEERLYMECLKDIEYAFSNNYPKHLHDKLLQRKQKAELYAKEQVHESYHEELPQLTYSSHPFIECGSDCIEIKFEQSLGRHVVSTRDIHVGDIIAIERPFSHILLKDNYLTHCYECLSPCYNLIPCGNCVLVMFCTEICKDVSCHKYECPILDTLLALQVNNLELIALKICMSVDIGIQEVNKGPFYKSERYEEIHNLVGNTHLRSVSDLFERSVKAAVIFELVREHTQFFIQHGDARQDTFKELLLLHLQTGPSNFHEISELRKINNSCNVIEVGSGAYGFLSLLNHSCSPNVVRHCHGNAIVLRALAPIGKGKQLFDNYGYHHAIMPKIERRTYLKSQYYFDCICEACHNNWPLYHDLPVKHFNISIDEHELGLLSNGIRHIVRNILERIEKTAPVFEEFAPCRDLSDVQEILKQCYAILGNKWEAL